MTAAGATVRASVVGDKNHGATESTENLLSVFSEPPWFQ